MVGYIWGFWRASLGTLQPWSLCAMGIVQVKTLKTNIITLYVPSNCDHPGPNIPNQYHHTITQCDFYVIATNGSRAALTSAITSLLFILWVALGGNISRVTTNKTLYSNWIMGDRDLPLNLVVRDEKENHHNI